MEAWVALGTVPLQTMGFAACALPDALCAGSEGSVDIDTDFACDDPSTDETEQCEVPSIVVTAPEEISSCPGSSLKLDASRSSGGGIKPLKFSWNAHPALRQLRQDPSRHRRRRL